MLTPDSPFYIVCNAASGSGDASQAREELAGLLDAANRRYRILLVNQPRNLAEIAKRAAEAAAESGGAVIGMGGDGTINAVAQAVLPTRRPFGIVPSGTFNYSSRAHGIPLETAAAVRALLTARVKAVQVGAVNDRIFLVNASLGLYPQLLQDREQFKRQYGRTRSVALWSGLFTLLREHRQLTVQIEHDREVEVVRTPSVFVGNNPLQLEQVGLPEAAEIGSGRLAAVIVRPVNTGRLLWLAVRGALGQLGNDDGVRNFSFRSMTVQPIGGGYDRWRGIKVAADGEIFRLQPPLRFAVAPHPLMLMVPSQAAEAVA